MTLISLALWLAGVALIALAVLQARRPLARLAELGRLAENARRYESWRGGRAALGTADGAGTTGADVMRRMLRQRVLLWTAVGIVGVLLLVAGFAVR